MGFRVRGIKKAHEDKGMNSAYEVWKQTGVAQNTVLKYISDYEIETKHIEVSLVRLCEFYGLNWRDPKVIEFVEESPKKAKTPLAVAS